MAKKKALTKLYSVKRVAAMRARVKRQEAQLNEQEILIRKFQRNYSSLEDRNRRLEFENSALRTDNWHFAGKNSRLSFHEQELRARHPKIAAEIDARYPELK